MEFPPLSVERETYPLPCTHATKIRALILFRGITGFLGLVAM